MDGHRPRRLALPGTYNVRDLGGYPTAAGGATRYGVLYRGDSLHRLDDRGRAMLAEARVRTVIDLRDHDEREIYRSALTDHALRVVELPLHGDGDADHPTSDDWNLSDTYVTLIEHRGPQFSAIAREIAAPGRLPALVHCMAGKDRTGVVAAVILSAVDVPEELVVSDFVASAAYLGDAYREEATERCLARGLDITLVPKVLAIDPAHIRRVLRTIDELHGGAAAYLRDHGLHEEELRSLKEHLVEIPEE